MWIESPGNPLLSITDIAACAEWAHARGILLAVDSTFATPVLTRPLELGADVVMHSATKYIGGHSDVLGGALVVANPELFERLYFIQNATGAVMGPLEAYLCSRGLKTLELRVREQCRTAQRLAEYLAQHPRVSRVFYPGLADHPGHELASRQMDGGFGAMVSFEITGDYQAAKRMVESTRLFKLAVSLGAVESLIEQPAAMSHASYDRAERLAHGLSDGLVRLSVGLEAFDDLRDDLDQAIAVAAELSRLGQLAHEARWKHRHGLPASSSIRGRLPGIHLCLAKSPSLSCDTPIAVAARCFSAYLGYKRWATCGTVPRRESMRLEG